MCFKIITWNYKEIQGKKSFLSLFVAPLPSVSVQACVKKMFSPSLGGQALGKVAIMSVFLLKAPKPCLLIQIIFILLKLGSCSARSAHLCPGGPPVSHFHMSLVISTGPLVPLSEHQNIFRRKGDVYVQHVHAGREMRWRWWRWWWRPRWCRTRSRDASLPFPLFFFPR